MNPVGITKLIDAASRFAMEFPDFCKCIDFENSALDAKALKFMNEMRGEFISALKHIAEKGGF